MYWKVSLIISLFFNSCYEDSYYEDICLDEPTHRQALYVISPVLWQDPVIAVCWEKNSYNYPHYQEWIINAVEGSWEAVSSVNFVGWDLCTDDFPGIRVYIGSSEGGAHAKGAGTDLIGKENGVVISDSSNVLFLEEGQVKYHAIHEFGHVLGFTHEHNRNDTPEECLSTFNRQGPDGDLIVGEWDSKSVMNYCSTPYFHAKLSCGDIRGVQDLYGSP